MDWVPFQYQKRMLLEMDNCHENHQPILISFFPPL